VGWLPGSNDGEAVGDSRSEVRGRAGDVVMETVQGYMVDLVQARGKGGEWYIGAERGDRRGHWEVKRI